MLFTTTLNQLEKIQAVVANLEHDSTRHYGELRIELAVLQGLVDHLTSQLSVLNKKVFVGNGESHDGLLMEHASRLAHVELWKKGIEDRFWKTVFASVLPLIGIIVAVAV